MQTASKFRGLADYKRDIKDGYQTFQHRSANRWFGVRVTILFSASSSALAWKLYEPVAEVVVPTAMLTPRAVEEKDGYVYLLAREGILYTYDISDLPLQESFTTYNTPVHKQALYSGNGSGLLRHGNYFYAFGRNGLDTIDVQDPCLPAPLSLNNDLNIYNMVRYENYLIAAGREESRSIRSPSRRIPICCRN
jgi:hypothetical protein